MHTPVKIQVTKYEQRAWLQQQKKLQTKEGDELAEEDDDKLVANIPSPLSEATVTRVAAIQAVSADWAARTHCCFYCAFNILLWSKLSHIKPYYVMRTLRYVIWYHMRTLTIIP